jgi:hypothetical protein
MLANVKSCAVIGLNRRFRNFTKPKTGKESIMEQNNRPKWLLPVGIGCLVILCLCLLGAGGFYFLGDRLVGDLGEYVDIPGDLGDFSDIGELLVETSIPDEEPPVSDSPANPPATDPGPLSEQYSTETSFFDDFSTDALDWAVVDDGITSLQYENQAYSFMLKEPSTVDGVWIPSLFSPTTVRFDVWGPPGEQDGSTGVECQIQDDDFQNYYYIEFDLYYNQVVIGGVYDGEYVDFVETTDDFGWLQLNNMTPNPEDPDTIEINCELDTITVIVNGSTEQTVPVPEPFTTQGGMTLFLYTYETSMAGYKVFFDNVYAYP